MTKLHEGLPVPGYRPQSEVSVAQVRSMKEAEERILRLLDALAAAPAGTVDPRWYAVGRRHIEQGFMEVNRSIFQPARVRLPEDEA